MFYTILGLLVLLPSFVHAAPPDRFDDFVRVIIDLLQLVLPVLVALALLVFFWGLAKFILNAGNETVVTEGKQLMFWGIVALFVMLSAWGLAAILANTFGFTISFPIKLPYS